MVLAYRETQKSLSYLFFLLDFSVFSSIFSTLSSILSGKYLAGNVILSENRKIPISLVHTYLSTSQNRFQCVKSARGRVLTPQTINISSTRLERITGRSANMLYNIKFCDSISSSERNMRSSTIPYA